GERARRWWLSRLLWKEEVQAALLPRVGSTVSTMDRRAHRLLHAHGGRVALVAGLLFANALVQPRKAL
ncbi:MAG TPA: hypothetical protein VEZ71_02850, partial [Archangium sp.]|nr:hypothetical protein [Archangium sp.]